MGEWGRQSIGEEARAVPRYLPVNRAAVIRVRARGRHANTGRQSGLTSSTEPQLLQELIRHLFSYPPTDIPT